MGFSEKPQDSFPIRNVLGPDSWFSSFLDKAAGNKLSYHIIVNFFASDCSVYSSVSPSVFRITIIVGHRKVWKLLGELLKHSPFAIHGELRSHLPQGPCVWLLFCKGPCEV